MRHENGGRQAVVLLAAETSGLANPREAVACRLLQKILGKKSIERNFCDLQNAKCVASKLKKNSINALSGDGPRVPYGNGVGQLQKAVNAKVGSDVNFAVSAINYGYVDSGLIGAFIVADAASAGKVIILSTIFPFITKQFDVKYLIVQYITFYYQDC